MASASGTAPEKPVVGYGFERVVLRTDRRELLVDGEPVVCQPLVFDFLLLLCAARGATVKRTELFSRLWPDSPSVSDESLTQLVYKLRTALGAAGAAVVTVRGVGVRLEAKPRPLYEEEEPAGASPAALPPAVTPFWRGRAGLLAVTLVGLAALAYLGLRDPVVAIGWGLRASDIRCRGECGALLLRALEAAAEGKREAAADLALAASRHDEDAPLPAAFALSWSRPPDAARESALRGEVSRRLGQTRGSEYATHLSRYLALGGDTRAGEEKRLSEAILAIRPEAGLIRLHLGHVLIGLRELEGAAAVLARLDVEQLPPREAAVLLGDRASLGDPDGAETALAGSAALRGRLHYEAYVRGRSEWSRRNAAQASATYAACERAASAANVPELAERCGFFAALAEAALGRWSEAQAAFDQSAASAADRGDVDRTFEALALGAYAAHRRRDPAGRDGRLVRAAGLLERIRYVEAHCQALRLVALELGSEAVRGHAECPVREEDPHLLGVRTLVAARRAFSAGRLDEARHLLDQARAEAIERTYFREHAELLAKDLGGGGKTAFPDPPYPQSLRMIAACESGNPERGSPRR